MPLSTIPCCPLCSSLAPEFYLRDKRRQYLQCMECSLVFVPPGYHLSAEKEKAEYDLHCNSPDDAGYRKAVHEWVCIHLNKIIAYIAFSNAYNGSAVCGLHLAPLAVKPEFQKQGIGSELLRFALRQDVIKANTFFALGDPGFYQKFGFKPCAIPVCPFDKNNGHFLSIRNNTSSRFTVGYEPEFNIGA